MKRGSGLRPYALKKIRTLVVDGKAISDHGSVRQQEEQIADDIGGQRHLGSGAFANKKSDVSNERYQIEAKQTQNASLSLKQEWLIKISKEAMGKSKVPLMHLRFLNRKDVICEDDWVVMPYREFKRLVGGEE